MRLFDLHCDTPFELYKRDRSLQNNDLHISLDKAKCFENYGQVMAIWTENTLSDEAAWDQFHAIYRRFLSEIRAGDGVLCRGGTEGNLAFSAGKTPLFLAVEGANLLCGELSRLDTLYEMGVRLLTLVWKGESIIGGAYDTSLALTDFGRAVVLRCFDLGIAVDVSHASDPMIEECLSLAKQKGRPIVATHSDSRALCPHPRNLTDAQAAAIAETGGLIGVSLAPRHLDSLGQAEVLTVCRHILHGLELGIGAHLALGCDFDGISITPRGIGSIADLPRVYEMLLSLGVEEKTADDIFFGNARRFFLSHFK